MVTKGLKLKISALETLYSGQFTLSTQLMKSKYHLLSIASSVQSFSAAADMFFLNPFSASVFNSWRPLTFQCWFSVVEDTPLRMLPGAGRFCYWLSVIWIALIVWWSAVRSAVTDQNYVRWPHSFSLLFLWFSSCLKGVRNITSGGSGNLKWYSL